MNYQRHRRDRPEGFPCQGESGGFEREAATEQAAGFEQEAVSEQAAGFDCGDGSGEQGICPVCGQRRPEYRVEDVGRGVLGCERCLRIRRNGVIQL